MILPFAVASEKGTPIRLVKQEELCGAKRLKITLAVRPKSIGVCCNVPPPPQGWTDPVLEALCFNFYVNHEMIDEVQKLLILNDKPCFVQHTFDSTLRNEGLLNFIMCQISLNSPAII
jgi:hypothetical protein